MQQYLAEISQKQRKSWNKFSPGWKKWDNLTMDFLKPTGREIIRLINPKENDTVLDVAAGTGEPGLSIAGRLTGGKVVLTDLSEEMLAIARENARNSGTDNIETKVCDVSELPFPDNSFDAVSCRFGFMFFPDMEMAAKEMARVLKPGGRIAAAVWSAPEKNFWVTATMGTIKKIWKLPRHRPVLRECSVVPKRVFFPVYSQRRVCATSLKEKWKENSIAKQPMSIGT